MKEKRKNMKRQWKSIRKRNKSMIKNLKNIIEIQPVFHFPPKNKFYEA